MIAQYITLFLLYILFASNIASMEPDITNNSFEQLPIELLQEIYHHSINNESIEHAIETSKAFYGTCKTFAHIIDMQGGTKIINQFVACCYDDLQKNLHEWTEADIALECINKSFA